jgi:micrococcal nuclease
MSFPVVSIDRVVDADTLHITVDRGWRTYSKHELRITGIDAPEKRTPLGNSVSFIVQDLVTRLAISKPPMTLVSEGVDSFGRSLGDLQIYSNRAGGEYSIADYLLVNKLAVMYKNREYKTNPKFIETATAIADIILVANKSKSKPDLSIFGMEYFDPWI